MIEYKKVRAVKQRTKVQCFLLGKEVILIPLVSCWCIVGKPCQVKPNQQPVPSPWSRNGNIRFKRRTGSRRAETRVKWLSPVIILSRRGRCLFFSSRQNAIDRYGEILSTLPGSESLASLMRGISTEQMRSCNVWETSMLNQGRERARWANALQEVRPVNSTIETCESRWREGTGTT